MQKNNLANIVYEKTIQRAASQRLKVSDSDNKQKNITKNQKSLNMFQPLSTKNHMIKITQLSSGTNNLPTQYLSTSSSPAKQLQLRKVSEVKQKSAFHSFNFVEAELRLRQFPLRRDKKQVQLLELNTEQATKIFITSKWNLKSQIANMDFLTNHITSTQSVVIVRPQQLQNFEPTGQAVFGTAKEMSTSRQLKKTVAKQRTRVLKNIEEKQYSYKSTESHRMVSCSPQKLPSSPQKRYDRLIIEQKKYQENLQKQKKQLLQTRKQLNKNYAKPFLPPQNISAFSYIIFQADIKKNKLRKFSAHQRDQEQINQIRKFFQHSHKVVASLNSRTAVQIASLTKIMTCIVAIEIASKFTLLLDEQKIKVDIFQQNVGGTRAGIKKGEFYSLRQLFYGLMLPSGNDASVAIAVWGGKTLLQREQTRKQQNSTQSDSNKSELRQFVSKKKVAYDRFILEMNKKAAQLNMQKTKYCNSHGLSNAQNRSCCFDLSILCQYAMKNKTFRQIVSCKMFQTQILIEGESISSSKSICKDNPLRESKRSLKAKLTINYLNSDEARLENQQMKNIDYTIEEDFIDEDQTVDKENDQKVTRRIKWENTHQLLQTRSDLYVGIKTGVTCTAGPCLASCLEWKGRRWIIIVLSCKNMKMRIKDTQNLRKWLFIKQGIKFTQGNNNQIDDQLFP